MSKPGHNSGKGGPRSRIHTYVIQAGVGGPVKIGLAQNVHSRCNELQTGNHEELRIVRIVAGNIERAMHRRFKANRIRREWFWFDAEMLTFLPAETEDDVLMAAYRLALDMPAPPPPATVYLAEAPQ